MNGRGEFSVNQILVDINLRIEFEIIDEKKDKKLGNKCIFSRAKFYYYFVRIG